MKPKVLENFDGHIPKAVVLDDTDNSRRSIARRLRAHGFFVHECATVEQFFETWAPGMFDLIVADWQLSEHLSIYGDKVLEDIRKLDWDVPFVLISGKLDEAEADCRATVFEGLLHEQNASVVFRGDDGVGKVYEESIRLLERRDATLLRVILALRKAAEQGHTIQTTSGPLAVAEQLAALVASPDASHQTLSSLSKVRGARFKVGD